jgi:hypothetical protein
MPRAKTDSYWVERVSELAEDGLSVRAITEKLEAEAKQLGRKDFPSEHTVRRIRDAYDTLEPHVREQQQRLRWPQSFKATGEFTWDAVRSALDLLQYCDRMGLPRPTVRKAKWFWRLRQASPSMPDEQANRYANSLASAEYLQIAGFKSQVTEAAQWQLAYQPWLDDEHRQIFESSPRAVDLPDFLVVGTHTELTRAAATLVSENIKRNRHTVAQPTISDQPSVPDQLLDDVDYAGALYREAEERGEISLSAGLSAGSEATPPPLLNPLCQSAARPELPAR